MPRQRCQNTHAHALSCQLSYKCAPAQSFFEVSSLAGSDDPEAYSGGLELDPEIRQWARQGGFYQIAMGRIFIMKLPQGSVDYKASACVDQVFIINGRNEVQADMGMQELQSTPGAEDSCRGIIGNAVTAIEELLLINSDPTYFIFEKSPAKPRQFKAGRISRSPDRSRYIPLKPEAIRRVMGLDRSGADGAGVKRPHERRRHWRLLSSDRYKHKQGQRVLVDACWVGPTEAVIGKTRYRVRLDI